jgi:2'-5' RNA ligase
MTGCLDDPRSGAARRAHPDHHATIFVPPEVAADVEAARRRWDPVTADRIAAHVTLVYPAEAPVLELLVERLRAAAAVHAPFSLRLGALGCWQEPERGVYLAVHDVDGAYARLRDAVLQPPFRPLSFPPHVTLVHPATSGRGRELWDERAGPGWPERVFTVAEVAIAEFDGVRWIALERIALGKGGPG